MPQGIEVLQTDSGQIIKEKSLNTDVLAFVMPGGAATPYRQKLAVQGNDFIRDYVRQGGIYFGVCAGAYYACHQVFFEVDVPELKIVNQCGLDLVQGDAVGTLYKEFSIRPYAQNATSETIIPVRWHADDQRCWTHYSGGPYFSNLEQGVQILASYDSLTTPLPALVEKQYGAGRVILSGVHFENTPSSLLRGIYKDTLDEQYAKHNAAVLKIKEVSHQSLVQKILDRIV